MWSHHFTENNPQKAVSIGYLMYGLADVWRQTHWICFHSKGSQSNLSANCVAHWNYCEADDYPISVVCVCVVGFLGGRGGCSCPWWCYVFNLFNDQHWNFKVQYNNKPIFTLCSPMLRNSQMSDEFFNQDIFISNFSLMIIICLWGTCCKVGWKFQNFDHKMSFIAGGHFQGK